MPTFQINTVDKSKESTIQRQEKTDRKWNELKMKMYGVRAEKAMAAHSSTLAWKIPWVGEAGSLQSMGSLRVGHDWATSLPCFTFMHWEGNGNPLQCSCLENPRDGGAWWAAVYGVAQSQTRLKQLSSSSSSAEVISLQPLHKKEETLSR